MSLPNRGTASAKKFAANFLVARTRLLRGAFDDDEGVIVVDDGLVMGTAPLVVVSGAVVGAVRGCPAG